MRRISQQGLTQHAREGALVSFRNKSKALCRRTQILSLLTRDGSSASHRRLAGIAFAFPTDEPLRSLYMEPLRRLAGRCGASSHSAFAPGSPLTFSSPLYILLSPLHSPLPSTFSSPLYIPLSPLHSPLPSTFPSLPAGSSSVLHRGSPPPLNSTFHKPFKVLACLHGHSCGLRCRQLFPEEPSPTR